MLTTEERTARLAETLKRLRLPTVRACYEEQADLARREALSYEHYLLELLERECEVRQHKRIERYLRESKLPFEKTMAAFDRNRLPERVNHQVSVLLEGGFFDRRENILAFGNPGSGKTHLLCALGQELIYQGRRVLFRPCSLRLQGSVSPEESLRAHRVDFLVPLRA